MTPTGPGSNRSGDRHWERAQRYVADGQYAAARAMLETLLSRAPGNARARVLLASVLLAQGRLRNTCEELCRAAKALPDDPELIATVAWCLHRVGETRALRDCLEHPAVAQAESGPALLRLALLRQLLGQHRDALALMDLARSRGLDTPDFRYYHSLQLQFNGRTDEAERELVAGLPAGAVNGRGAVLLASLRRQTSGSNHLDYLEAQLGRVEPRGEDHAAFEFARFKELDDLGRTEEAWMALARANSLMHARTGHDVEQERACFETVTRITSEAFVTAAAPTPGGAVPIFIVGMPRSGTTLLERIVSNHSLVAACGELPDFLQQMRWTADCPGNAFMDRDLFARAAAIDYGEVGRRYLEQTQWRAQGKPFFIDKFPANFMLAGFIRRALPRARILHMVRPAMDLCFSDWKALFGEGAYPFSYEQEALAHHYLRYRSLMAHWRKVMPGAMLDVHYDELVVEPDRVVRRVFGFCGLPFEPGCADVSANPGPIATLSTVQAREPIHRRALGQWRTYAAQMRPLQDALGNLGDS